MRSKLLAPLSAMAVLCLPPFIHSQSAPAGFITVYGSKLTDASGVAANAQLCAQAVDATGRPISLKPGGGGGGTTTMGQVCSNAAGGSWSINLPDTRLSSPVNAGFAFTAIDNVSGADLIGPGYGFVQPTSDPASKWCTATLCNFDNLPPMSKPAVGATFLQGASGTNGLNGKDGAVGCPVGATACAGVVGTAPTGNQYVKQPASTSTYTNSLNGWQYVGDATSGVDILTQVQTAYNACNVLQANSPNKCNIKVNPAPAQSDVTIPACWHSTATLSLPRHNYNNFTVDFTGARICHSGPNGVVDMSGGQVSNMGGSLLEGLEVGFTGEEPYIIKTDIVANIKFRDLNFATGNIDPKSNQTVCMDLHGGNQLEISNSIFGQCYDVIKMSRASDGFGVGATTITGNSLGPLHMAFNMQASFANVVIDHNTIQGGYFNDFPVGDFHGGQGIKYTNNYHEFGNHTNLAFHMLHLGADTDHTIFAGNTFADTGDTQAAIVLDEANSTTYRENWITTTDRAFVDFGSAIDSVFNLVSFYNNRVIGGYTQIYDPATVPQASSSRSYSLRVFEQNDSGYGPTDNQTNPYFFSSAGPNAGQPGMRINSITAPGTGLLMHGTYKFLDTPVTTPASGDAYVCISGTDNSIYRSQTPCH